MCIRDREHVDGEIMEPPSTGIASTPTDEPDPDHNLVENEKKLAISGTEANVELDNQAVDCDNKLHSMDIGDGAEDDEDVIGQDHTEKEAETEIPTVLAAPEGDKTIVVDENAKNTDINEATAGESDKCEPTLKECAKEDDQEANVDEARLAASEMEATVEDVQTDASDRDVINATLDVDTSILTNSVSLLKEESSPPTKDAATTPTSPTPPSPPTVAEVADLAEEAAVVEPSSPQAAATATTLAAVDTMATAVEAGCPSSPVEVGIKT